MLDEVLCEGTISNVNRIYFANYYYSPNPTLMQVTVLPIKELIYLDVQLRFIRCVAISPTKELCNIGSNPVTSLSN